jgi:hypothetical protein
MNVKIASDDELAFSFPDIVSQGVAKSCPKLVGITYVLKAVCVVCCLAETSPVERKPVSNRMIAALKKIVEAGKAG